MRMTKVEFVKAFGEKALNELLKDTPKYHNQKCEWKGIKFDSVREMNRFIILKHDEQEGRITDLNRQVRFQLLPSQKDESGRVIEKPCFYVADFTYRRGGKLVVEDVKSKATMTPVYRLKRKLMLWFHGIRIEEV